MPRREELEVTGQKPQPEKAVHGQFCGSDDPLKDPFYFKGRPISHFKAVGSRNPLLAWISKLLRPNALAI
jgi:hypothetical protein